MAGRRGGSRDRLGPGQPGPGSHTAGRQFRPGSTRPGSTASRSSAGRPEHRVPGRPPAAAPGSSGRVSRPGQPYPGQPYPGQPVIRVSRTPASSRAARACATRAGSDGSGSPVIRQRDSALPDPPPSAKGPIAAIETDNIGAFARDLRVLRSKVGLDYPDMAEKSHYTMRTLASAAGGLRLPTLPVLIAYVNACGGDVAEWEERWGRLTKAGKKGTTALPAAGQDAAGRSQAGARPASSPGPASPARAGSARRAADRRDLRHHLGQAARRRSGSRRAGCSVPRK